MSVYGSGLYGVGLYGVDSIVITIPSNQPTLSCEISQSDPTQPPSWVNVTNYLKAFTVSRGRAFELEQMGAGRSTITLDNRDGQFNPYNTSGPYYGNLRRMRRIRLRATWNNGVYPIYSGFIEEWQQNLIGVDNVEAILLCVDGFGPLAMVPLNATYPEEKSDARLARVLDAALWTTGAAWVLGNAALGTLGVSTILAPVGDRQLAAGQRFVHADTLEDVQALSHIHSVQDTEDGWAFINADGTFVFYDRGRRVAQAGKSTLITFGDRPTTGGELMYVEVELSDNVPLYSSVSVSRDGGTTQRVQDATSRQRYFPRNLSLTTLDVSDAWSSATAQYYLQRYKEPAQRVTSLRLDPFGDPNVLWPQILGRELADPITVRVRPAGSAMLEQQSWIEGIDHEWSAAGGDWVTIWRLSPIDQNPGWLLGMNTLGVNTVVGI